jgi:predicted ATP-binding protein involved in virulence
MRIDTLKVENFRCFEMAEFNFSPRFNLLVGVNGAGKTSLLKAIAASLATPLNGLGKSTIWPHAEERNARLELVETHGRLRYERCFPVRVDVAGEISGELRSWWLAQEGPGNEPEWEHTVFSALSGAAARVVQGASDALPVVAFYSSERQWQVRGVSPEQAVRQQDSRLDGYVSWHDAALDTEGFESWVVAKSLERLELASFSGSDDGAVLIDELALVNQAVAKALPGAKGVRFDIKYRRMVLDWEGKDPVPFDALSDGQRVLTALVADIARRMCLLNPQLGNDVLPRTPGIVLIDELDMHLHPAWQRKVVGMLKGVFPKVQFFAASHSPQIIGELQPKEIILMHSGGTSHPQASYGLDSSQVLEEIMGTTARAPEVEKLLSELFDALERNELDKARTQLSALTDMAPGIAELGGARALLKRKEVLGR